MANGDVCEAASGALRMSPAMQKLCVGGLAKRYGSVDALPPTDLTVASGEVLTVLGPPLRGPGFDMRAG
jgi:hypothetical protein